MNREKIDELKKLLGVLGFWFMLFFYTSFATGFVAEALHLDELTFFAIITVELLMSGVLTVVWTMDIIPLRAIRLGRHIPIILILALLAISLPFIVDWSMVLSSYMRSMEVEFAEALSITVGATLVASILVFAKGVFQRQNLVNSSRRLPIDQHTATCMKAGIVPHEVLTPGRLGMVSQHNVSNDYMHFSREATENILEIVLGLAVAATALAVYGWVFNITGHWEPDAFLLAVSFFFSPAILYFPYSIWSYRKWRQTWSDYWAFVRNMTLPHERILDELQPIGTSFLASLTQFKMNMPESFVAEARRLADKYGLDFTDEEATYEHVEFINWYHRTHEELKTKQMKELIEKFPVFEQIKEEFESLGSGFPEERFPDLVRSSLVLSAANIARRLPTVFDAIAELRDWQPSEGQSHTRAELFATAIEKLESIKGLPPIPIPSSIKWLLGFLVFSLTMLPYIMAFGAAVAG